MRGAQTGALEGLHTHRLVHYFERLSVPAAGQTEAVAKPPSWRAAEPGWEPARAGRRPVPWRLPPGMPRGLSYGTSHWAGGSFNDEAKTLIKAEWGFRAEKAQHLSPGKDTGVGGAVSPEHRPAGSGSGCRRSGQPARWGAAAGEGGGGDAHLGAVGPRCFSAESEAAPDPAFSREKKGRQERLRENPACVLRGGIAEATPSGGRERDQDAFNARRGTSSVWTLCPPNTACRSAGKIKASSDSLALRGSCSLDHRTGVAGDTWLQQRGECGHHLAGPSARQR